MRILANHGGDKRFAFLRGRWARTWKVVKGRARIQKEKEPERSTAQSSGHILGGLVGYGDSDGDSDKEDDQTGEGRLVSDETLPPDGNKNEDDVEQEAVKEARRARARDWAEKRRALKASQS